MHPSSLTGTPQTRLTWILRRYEITNNRVIGAIIVVVLVVCAVAIFFVVQQAPAAETFKISGYVKSDGTALAGATVTVDGKSATTNASGYYEITGLTGGKSYTITVSKSGYETYGGTVQLENADVQVSEISLKIAAGVEMPLEAIKSALAAYKGVSADNVEIYFCDQAAESDNFAAGAVISKLESIVFFYNESTNQITAVENDYVAATSDELSAMSIIDQKQPVSRFTEQKLVPFNFVKQDSTYTFNYYDGYDMYLLSWGFGNAVIDENGDIPEDNMTHTWI